MSRRRIPCQVCDCCEYWRNNPPKHRVVVQFDPSSRRQLLEAELAAIEAELRRRGEDRE